MVAQTHHRTTARRTEEEEGQPDQQNKLPESLENPLDAFLLRWSAKAMPTLYRMGQTPNLLTTYSFLCGLLSVLCLAKDQLVAFAVLYSVSYVFDCMDGQFARRYNMMSKFGDYYDHVTDITVCTLVVAVVLVRWRHVLGSGDLVVAAVVLGLTMAHMGCQQRHHDTHSPKKDTETLDGLRVLCPCTEATHWTRYFGIGTFQVFVVVYVVFIALRSRAHTTGAAIPEPSWWTTLWTKVRTATAVRK